MAFWDRDSSTKLGPGRPPGWRIAVTLRIAGAADAPALERLAQLDTRALPPGPHLVAEREGRIDAALSLSSGELVADPFRRTAELGALLRCQAGERRARPPSISPQPQLQSAAVTP
jgi:hypothetical protein